MRNWYAAVVGLILIGSVGCGGKSEEGVRADMVLGTVRVINIDGQATGSGVLLGNGDYVATNWHVVDENLDGRPDRKLLVAAMVDSKTRTLPAEVVWSPTPIDRDLAILHLPEALRGRSSPALRSGPQAGEAAWAIGFPGVSDDFAIVEGSDLSVLLSPTINQGSISRIHDALGPLGGARAIQHQVPINPGNSGGPLYDRCGNVMGLNTLASRDAQGTNFAVSVAELEPGLQSLNIRRTVVTSCSVGSGTSWGVWLLLSTTLVLAGTALVLSMTKGGRQVVRNVTRRVTQPAPIASVPSAHLPPLPGRPPVGLPPVPGGLPPVPVGGMRQPLPPLPGAPGVSGNAFAQMKAVSGEYFGMLFGIDDKPILMGRDPTLRGVVFSADSAGSVSKQHCEVRWDPMRHVITLTDLGSSNGTFMGDHTRLSAHTPRDLRSGDRFYLATPGVMFEIL